MMLLAMDVQGLARSKRLRLTSTLAIVLPRPLQVTERAQREHFYWRWVTDPLWIVITTHLLKRPLACSGTAARLVAWQGFTQSSSRQLGITPCPCERQFTLICQDAKLVCFACLSLGPALMHTVCGTWSCTVRMEKLHGQVESAEQVGTVPCMLFLAAYAMHLAPCACKSRLDALQQEIPAMLSLAA